MGKFIGAIFIVPIIGWLIFSGIASFSVFSTNDEMEAQAHSLVSEDHNDIVLPLQFEAIAVRNRGPISRNDSFKCRGFCMHALLNGVTKKFLVVQVSDLTSPPSVDDKAMQFSLQKMENCPQTKFTPGHHSLKLPRNGTDQDRSASAIEEMKLRMVLGECLISEPATLGNADILVRVWRPVSGRRPFDLGFSLSSDAVFADRMAVYRINRSSDSFKEVYRWTGVQYYPIRSSVFPTVNFRGAFKMRLGWPRDLKRINIANKYYERPDLVGLLTKSLGLDLVLRGEETRTKVLSLIKGILQEKRSPKPSEWSLLSTYFERIGIGRNTEPDGDDFALSLEILANPFFPVPRNFTKIARYASKYGAQDQVRLMADLLLERIERGRTWSEALPMTLDRNIPILALSLQSLPTYAFEGQFERIEKLSHELRIQENGYWLIRKMHVFGERAVPTFIRMIQTALASNYNGRGYDKYAATGLHGLCMVGSAAKPALPYLLEFETKGIVPSNSDMKKQYFRALSNAGADQKTIERIFSSTLREGESLELEALQRRLMSYLTKPPSSVCN